MPAAFHDACTLCISLSMCKLRRLQHRLAVYYRTASRGSHCGRLSIAPGVYGLVQTFGRGDMPISERSCLGKLSPGCVGDRGLLLLDKH